MVRILSNNYVSAEFAVTTDVYFKSYHQWFICFQCIARSVPLLTDQGVTIEDLDICNEETGFAFFTAFLTLTVDGCYQQPCWVAVTPVIPSLLLTCLWFC